MNLKQGRLLQGLRALSQHSPDYTYTYSATNIYACSITALLEPRLSTLHPSPSLPDLLQEFAQYLALPKQLLGKRSSQIMVSQSRGLCFKLMDEVSVVKMERIAQDLCAHLAKHSGSCLVDVLRVYRINSRKDNFKQSDVFLLMPCLMPPEEQCIAVYDIKGYTEGREVGESEFGIFKFGKDSNLVHSKQIYLLEQLPKATRKQILANIIVDIQFLEARDIIDYSLLLAFQNSSKVQSSHSNDGDQRGKWLQVCEGVVLRWGIIDYFQEYNSKKKAENKIKSLFLKQISSVEPNIYAERLIRFLVKIFHITE